jgi:hypothetical protein
VTRASIIIALVATFLIGASLGLMGGILFSTHQPHMGRPVWMGAGPRMGGPRFPGIGAGGDPDRRALRERQVLPHLRSELDLTDAQVARIRVLLEEAHASMGAARDSLRARIERELTAEQRERWARLEARHRYPGAIGGPAGPDSGRPPQPDEERR